MSYQKSRSRRTYVYRIPADDRFAMLRIRRFERNSDYWISQIPDRDVPNSKAVKNWGCVFYRSKEQHGDQPGEFTGGTVPGLEEYRHSLDWEPHPETELLEMKRSSDGGTKIRGESFLGTSDPRLSDYVKINMEVPWTPKEIKDIWNGDPVPDKMNYTVDAPEISSSEAMEQWNEAFHWAKQDGFEAAKKELQEFVDNCEHNHVVKTGDVIGSVAYCEDCGKEWHDDMEFEAEEEVLTIVG